MSPRFKSAPSTVADASIWVGTGYMDLLNPNPAEIHLKDIARALSRLARFNGHGRSFYSVAEHCVNCVRVFEAETPGGLGAATNRGVARAVLMHDAAEAYLGDITSPLKAHLPEFRLIEYRMALAIRTRFNLLSAPIAVKHCDLAMLRAEKATLLPECPDDWPCLEGVEDPGIFICGDSPGVAEANFLQMAEYLEMTEEDWPQT